MDYQWWWKNWNDKLKMNIYYERYKKHKDLQWCQKRHFPCWTAEYVGWGEGSSKIYHYDLHCGRHMLLGKEKPSAASASYAVWNNYLLSKLAYNPLFFFIHECIYSIMRCSCFLRNEIEIKIVLTLPIVHPLNWSKGLEHFYSTRGSYSFFTNI